jgi:hypothetical protein
MMARRLWSDRTHVVLLAVGTSLAVSAIASRVLVIEAAADDTKVAAPGDAAIDAAALAACDAFMEAFNSSDMTAWRRTLNYPHVRLAGGSVAVSNTPDEYEREWDFNEFARRTGWHHSRYDHKQVVQRGPGKAHVAVRFTRYRADGSKIATYDALYVVTQVDGHWGVQTRSSFAPRK